MPAPTQPLVLPPGSGQRALGVTIVVTGLLALALVFALLIAPAFAEAPYSLAETPYGLFGRAVTVKFDVAATPHAVYAQLTDYPHLTEFFKAYSRVEVVEADAVHARLKVHLRYLGLFDLAATSDRTMVPDREIRWKGTAGPRGAAQGTWTLTPAASGTSVVYETQVDPGLPLPPPLVGMLIQRGIPDLVDSVRHRAESGGTWRHP